MTMPADVTHIRDWTDMVAAAHTTAARISQLRSAIHRLRYHDLADDTTTARDTVTPDPTHRDTVNRAAASRNAADHAAADRAVTDRWEAAWDRERLDRLDYETDFDLDGDYHHTPDPQPGLDQR